MFTRLCSLLHKHMAQRPDRMYAPCGCAYGTDLITLLHGNSGVQHPQSTRMTNTLEAGSSFSRHNTPYPEAWPVSNPHPCLGIGHSPYPHPHIPQQPIASSPAPRGCIHVYQELHCHAKVIIHLALDSLPPESGNRWMAGGCAQVGGTCINCQVYCLLDA